MEKEEAAGWLRIEIDRQLDRPIETILAGKILEAVYIKETQNKDGSYDIAELYVKPITKQ